MILTMSNSLSLSFSIYKYFKFSFLIKLPKLKPELIISILDTKVGTKALFGWGWKEGRGGEGRGKGEEGTRGEWKVNIYIVWMYDNNGNEDEKFTLHSNINKTCIFSISHISEKLRI